MDRKKTYVLLSALLLIVVNLGVWEITQETYIIEHESAHKQIFLYFGCDNPEINYKYDLLGYIHGGETSCPTQKQITPEEAIAMESLHAQNEIFGYTTQSTIQTILAAVYSLEIFALLLK